MGRERIAYTVLALSISFFIAGRVFYGAYFVNNWSFDHWNHISTSYLIAWVIGAVLVLAALYAAGDRLAHILSSRVAAIAGGTILGLLFFALQFDSFVYAGGNFRVAQLAQVPLIVFRWYEFGATALAAAFFSLFLSLVETPNLAGFFAWKYLALFSTLASLAASILIARELTSSIERRLLLFLIVFFGPQTILYFGMTGPEPLMVATTLWFFLMAIRNVNTPSLKSLFGLWIVQLVGISLHISTVFLLPATIFLTLRSIGMGSIAFYIGLATYLAGLAGTYMLASSDFEIVQYLLMLDGKPPFGDYSLFSARHLGDMLQLFLLAAPAILFTKYILVRKAKTVLGDDLSLAGVLLALSGCTVAFISDPVDSIVLDYPRLAAYLAPIGLLTAALLRKPVEESGYSRKMVAVVATLAIVAPISVAPVYVKIDTASPYAEAYFENHELNYMRGCYAFRDSYFAKGDLDQANSWEWKLPTASSDFLDFRGANDLIMNGDEAEALRLLQRMQSKNPVWVDVRILAAGLQMKAGRPQLARADIDTALMLEPYRRDVLMNNYLCYRDLKKYYEARIAADHAASIFPGDEYIVVDRMIMNHHAGEFGVARTVADSLTAADSTLPQPYMIRGMIFEQERNAQQALINYQHFLRRAPSTPEAATVRQRIQVLNRILGQG